MVYKGKIEFSLCLFEQHTISTNEGVEVQLYAFLTSALDGGELSVSGAGYFLSWEKKPWCPVILFLLL
jgi:hypothetical protein